MNKTLFMIHGAMAGGWCWDNYKKFFEEKGYTCITPTLRFHNMDAIKEKPDPQLGSLSLRDYVSDLEKEIQKLPEKAIIIGHSMGGLLAQILASRNLAEAVVLMNPAPAYGMWSTLAMIKNFAICLDTMKFWKKPVRLSFAETIHTIGQFIPQKDHKKLYDKLVYESGNVLFEMGLWFLDTKKASYVDYSKIKCPILILTGQEDILIPPFIVKKIVKKYKKATYRKFSHHGHPIMLEPSWEKPAEYILEWLKTNKL